MFLFGELLYLQGNLWADRANAFTHTLIKPQQTNAVRTCNAAIITLS